LTLGVHLYSVKFNIRPTWSIDVRHETSRHQTVYSLFGTCAEELPSSETTESTLQLLVLSPSTCNSKPFVEIKADESAETRRWSH